MAQYSAHTPIPVRAADCLPAPPPGVTTSVAVLLPATVGLKITFIVQLAPIATDVPQSLL
jgi:hypothetical protein